MGASGLRKMAKREMSAPKVERSAMLKGIASESSSPKRAGRGGQREEELAEPEMRDDEKGFASNHAPEIRVMKIDGSKDSPELLSGRLDAPRDIPIARKVDIRDVTLADPQVASAAESITKSSIASPEGSEGRPMNSDDGSEIIGESPKGPKR
jgi:hypothetical protein